MKKKFFPILIILLLVLSFGMVGCKNNEEEEDNDKVVLPLVDESIKKSGNEVVFVSLDQSGRVTSMKATNHIRNTQFAYYEQSGVFAKSGHTNITSGRAGVIIKDGKALIPSLEEYDNFFYTLAMDYNYYLDLLPFKIDFKYKLNGYTVGYQSLAGASGRVEIEIELTPNKNSPDYFKENFAAQVQIPINLNNAHIISSEGAMGKVIVGTTATVAYMVLPNTTTKLNLELLTTNFKFDGIQATYQMLDIGDMISSFINFDDLGFSSFNQLSDGLETIIAEFNSAYGQMGQLFSGIEMLSELTSNNEITQLQELVDNLKSVNFSLGYRQPQASIKLTLENRAEHVEHYKGLADNLESTINLISSAYNNIISSINTLEPKVNKVKTYPSKFKNFENIIENLDSILEDILEIEDLGELSVETIANNKTFVGQKFGEIGDKNAEIKELFQNLILDMYPLALHLEDLALDTSSLENIINNIISFAQYIAIFKEQVIEFVDEINIGKANDIFSPYLDPLGIMDKFVKGVMEGDAGTPALVDALDLVLEGLQEQDFGSDVDFNQFARLYDINAQTKVRKIDELVMGFIEMNKALSIAQEGQDMSFYEGLEALASVNELIKLIPIDFTVAEAVSFLSEENLSPQSVQFVVKQQGF